MRRARFDAIGSVASAMSHHRETVTAVGAPQAAGPYSHAVKSNGLVFLSGQTPTRPRHRQARRGLDRRPDAPLPRQPRGRRGRGRRAAGRRGADGRSTSPTSRRSRTSTRRTARTSRATRRRAARSASPPCRSAPRSRSTRSWRCRTDARGDRATTSPRPGPPWTAIARRTPVLSSRTISERAGGVVVAEGREPPAHGLVQDPRRLGQARGARRGRLLARGGRGLGGQPRPEPGRRGARPRRAVRGVRARRRADGQGRGGARPGRDRAHGRRRRSTTASRGALERARRRRPRVRAPVRRPRHRRRPGLARARAARGRARTSRAWSCRSAAAGCARASRSRSSRRGPRSR